MTNTHVVTGTLTDPQTVKLSEPLPVGAGTVRVTVEVVPPRPPTRMTVQEFMDDLRRRRAEGQIPAMTTEEIDAWVADIKAARGD